MSKNKGFSSTSANRYSLALYELASEASLLAQIEKNSSAFLTLISNNEEFDNLIKDPTASQDVLINIINFEQLYGTTQEKDCLKNIVKIFIVFFSISKVTKVSRSF